jgi:hypothetical protein
MSIIVLFLFVFIATTRLKSTQYGYYLLALFRVPYYGYYLFLMHIYTFLKSIFGIIIIINKKIQNNSFKKIYFMSIADNYHDNIIYILYLYFIANKF